MDKNYCETRQRDEINRYGTQNLSASDEVQSSLDGSTKYGTFGNSPSSTFCMDIIIQCDKDICGGNCREGRRSWCFGTWFYKISNRSRMLKNLAGCLTELSASDFY